jgi:hypothetical protein
MMRTAQCGNSRAGIKSIMFAEKSDVAVWPTKKPAETRTKLEDHVFTTTTDMEMKVGKKFYRFEAKKATAELQYVLEGESGGRSLKASLAAYYNQFGANLHGFIAAVKNKELVILVKVGNDDWHLLGDEDEGAEIETFDSKTGKATTDAIGADFMFSKSGLEGATIYKGDVEQLLIPAIA